MPGNLSPEQRSVLATAYHVIESAVIYFRSVVPVVEETDARLLNGLIEMGVMSLERLPQYFPELQPLEEERKKRGGL